MVQIKGQSQSGRFSTVKCVSIKRQPKRRGMGANLMTEASVYDAAGQGNHSFPAAFRPAFGLCKGKKRMKKCRPHGIGIILRKRTHGGASRGNEAPSDLNILSDAPFHQADIAFLYTAFPFSSSEKRRGFFISGPADQARRSKIKALEKTAVFTSQQACDLPFQAGTGLFSAAGQGNRVQERWLEKNAETDSAGQKPRLRHGGGRYLQRHDFQTVSLAHSRSGFHGASVQKRPPFF